MANFFKCTGLVLFNHPVAGERYICRRKTEFARTEAFILEELLGQRELKVSQCFPLESTMTIFLG